MAMGKYTTVVTFSKGCKSVFKGVKGAGNQARLLAKVERASGKRVMLKKGKGGSYSVYGGYKSGGK
jgi:hypothetical protein